MLIFVTCRFGYQFISIFLHYFCLFIYIFLPNKLYVYYIILYYIIIYVLVYRGENKRKKDSHLLTKYIPNNVFV